MDFMDTMDGGKRNDARGARLAALESEIWFLWIVTQGSSCLATLSVGTQRVGDVIFFDAITHFHSLSADFIPAFVRILPPGPRVICFSKACIMQLSGAYVLTHYLTSR
jgi:hypothetical protein